MSDGTLLFGATDLASLCTVEDLTDFWSSSDLRGDLSASAGVDGVTSSPRPVASKVCSGSVVVSGESRADTEDAVADLKAVLRTGASQTVTRRRIVSAGNLDTSQTAIVRNAEERWLGHYDCRLLLGVELLDGLWYGTSQNIASAAGTQSIAGDTRTRKITATLSAGAVNPVITNTTEGNGYSFRYVGTVPPGDVEVDVLTRRVTGLTGSVDLSGNLRWSKSDPFQLDPGDNTITVSSGTCALDYYPAYQ